MKQCAYYNSPGPANRAADFHTQTPYMYPRVYKLNSFNTHMVTRRSVYTVKIIF